jgi:hypothetical protein
MKLEIESAELSFIGIINVVGNNKQTKGVWGN